MLKGGERGAAPGCRSRKTFPGPSERESLHLHLKPASVTLLTGFFFFYRCGIAKGSDIIPYIYRIGSFIVFLLRRCEDTVVGGGGHRCSVRGSGGFFLCESVREKLSINPREQSLVPQDLNQAVLCIASVRLMQTFTGSQQRGVKHCQGNGNRSFKVGGNHQ